MSDLYVDTAECTVPDSSQQKDFYRWRCFFCVVILTLSEANGEEPTYFALAVVRSFLAIRENLPIATPDTYVENSRDTTLGWGGRKNRGLKARHI